MPTKHHKPEQIIAKLREIEVIAARGKPVAAACKQAGISEQSDYHWKKEYGGLKTDQAKKLKELERENARLIIKQVMHQCYSVQCLHEES